MQIIKVILSFVALILGAAAACASPLHISDAAAAFLLAGASFLGTWGIQPFKIGAAVAAKLQGLAMLIAAALTAHAIHLANIVTPGPHAHLIAVLFFWLGVIGTLCGFIGRSYLQPTPAAARALDQPPPPPRAA